MSSDHVKKIQERLFETEDFSEKNVVHFQGSCYKIVDNVD